MTVRFLIELSSKRALDAKRCFLIQFVQIEKKQINKLAIQTAEKETKITKIPFSLNIFYFTNFISDTFILI